MVIPGWAVLGLLSALFASLVAIFGKLGLQGVDATAATAVRAAIMAVTLASVAAASGHLGAVRGFGGAAWWLVVASGVAGALSWLCYFLALQAGDAAAVAALDRLSLVFTVVLAALVLGESLTLTRAVGAALVVLGVFLISAQ